MDDKLEFIKNIDRQNQQTYNEKIVNTINNSVIYPPFKKYNDDSNRDLNPKLSTYTTYRSKSKYGIEKLNQTENDEVGVNEEFLNKHYGYKYYGNYYYQNSSIPERIQHKTTYYNNLDYDLF